MSEHNTHTNIKISVTCDLSCIPSQPYLQRNLPAVFIDTFYDKSSPIERDRFEENTQKLWDFAKSRNPFECKDIKIALTEIRELQVCEQH